MISLFPETGASGRDAYDALVLQSRRGDSSPYVGVNMVSTVDGQARLGINTDTLGDANDRALFLALRGRVDCVIAGSSTISAEQYKGPVPTPELQHRRVDAGLRPRPIFATITRSGKIDKSIPLFADSEIEVVVFSEADVSFDDCAATVHVERVTDARAVLLVLASKYAVGSVLLEGGPTLNGAFFADDLVDELFLTVAPVLAGGPERFPILQGTLPAAAELALVSALLGDDHLYLRYRVK